MLVMATNLVIELVEVMVLEKVSRLVKGSEGKLGRQMELVLALYWA